MSKHSVKSTVSIVICIVQDKAQNFFLELHCKIFKFYQLRMEMKFLSR